MKIGAGAFVGPNCTMEAGCEATVGISRGDMGVSSRGTNHISNLGKRKIIFKIPFLGDMLIPWRDSEGKTSVGNVGFLGYLWITYSGNRTLAGWKTDPD